jgi:hypothetical protein
MYDKAFSTARNDRDCASRTFEFVISFPISGSDSDLKLESEPDIGKLTETEHRE